MDDIKIKVINFISNISSKVSVFSTIIWSIVVGLVGLYLSESIYFKETYLFSVPFLGEVIIACTLFLLTYFFGKALVTSIGSAFENFVIKTFRKVLNELWKVQYPRILEVISRENKVVSVVEEKKVLYSPSPIVLDTSTIIDGRILGVIKTGFLDSPIIVPQNVIDELQHMADKSDALKRQKGRRGLDALKTIRKSMPKGVFNVVDLKSKPEDVDKSLVSYCKKHNAKIATVDYNLNKAAQVSGVKVLNINRLANEIKTNLLPGEIMIVKLVQKGKEGDQAVAYLEDGTMLVVKNASEHVGMHKEVRVEKVLQTSAGRMIFAELNS